MALAFVDAICTSLPGTNVRYPFESSPTVRAWCINKRMYAWCVTDQTPVTIQLKADTEIIPSLIANYDYVRPGYHMNKRHWISVEVDCEESRRLVRGLLEDAHNLVVQNLPKSERVKFLAD